MLAKTFMHNPFATLCFAIGIAICSTPLSSAQVQMNLTDAGTLPPAATPNIYSADDSAHSHSYSILQLVSGSQESDFEAPAEPKRDAGLEFSSEPLALEPAETDDDDEDAPIKDPLDIPDPDAPTLKLSDDTLSRDNGQRHSQTRPQRNGASNFDDTPVDVPTFNQPPAGRSQSPSEAASLAPTDNYRLPQIGNVTSPIHHAPLSLVQQQDPAGLLYGEIQPFPALSSGGSYGEVTQRAVQPKWATWKAHDFYHRQNYFEDEQLERYGNQRPIQPLVSALKFYGTIPVIPYKIGLKRPHCADFVSGKGRPGDHHVYTETIPELNKRAVLTQAVATLGLALP